MKVVVLGGGSSGEHFVGALRRLDGDAGLTVVERRLVGGECSYRACMPTKTMLRSAELAAAGRHTPGATLGALDVQAVFRRRDRVAERDDSSQVDRLASMRRDPQVATVGTLEGRASRWELTSTPRLSTYERPKRRGFVRVAADPERRVLTGAVGVGPEAGERLRQVTLAGVPVRDAPRRDPALPDLQRGGLPWPPRPRSRPMTFRPPARLKP